MRVEAVRDGRHYDPSDQDHHSEGHGAAVAGQLCSAGGRRQLPLIDQGDGDGQRLQLRRLVVVGFLLQDSLRSSGIVMVSFSSSVGIAGSRVSVFRGI